MQPRPDEDEQERWTRLKSFAEGEPYWRLLGLQLEELGQGYCRLRLPLGEAVRNFGHGPAHGGALASLVDIAVQMALDSLGLPGITGHATVQLNVTFLAPAEGEAVLVEGRILRAGQRLVVGEAEIRDGAGQLIAKGNATFFLWRQG